MSAQGKWEKVVTDKAVDLISADELEPESAQHLTADIRPEELIHALSEARQWPDAIKVMSRALPPREAVWWACVCARQMESLADDEGELAALEAAEKWVYKPNDENRRDAFDLAQENTSKSAGTLAAISTGLSGGTIPVPEDEWVEVDRTAFVKTVDAAAMVAAFEKKGQELHEQFARFLDSGEDIANGGSGSPETEK